MTVAQLISWLEQYPQEAKVTFWDAYSDSETEGVSFEFSEGKNEVLICGEKE